MAFTPGQQSGQSNGATEVEICSGPSSGQRIVKTVNIYNADTVSATVTVNFEDGATERILAKETVPAGSTMLITSPIVLAASDETLEMILDGAVTTNELDFYVAYADIT
jgi:hypothetical protein